MKKLHYIRLYRYTIKIQPRSKSTQFKKKIISLCYIFFALILFFTFTITPNSYPRSVSGSRI